MIKVVWSHKIGNYSNAETKYSTLDGKSSAFFGTQNDWTNSIKQFISFIISELKLDSFTNIDDSARIKMKIPYKNRGISIYMTPIFLSYDDYPIELFLNGEKENTLEFLLDDVLVAELEIIDPPIYGRRITKKENEIAYEKMKNLVNSFLKETDPYVSKHLRGKTFEDYV